MSSESLRRIFLVLNVGLAVTALVLAMQNLRGMHKAPVPAPQPMTVKASLTPAMVHYPDAKPAADQRRWIIDQLRAMGVPNKVLARIAMKDLDQRWNKYATEVSLKCRGNPEVLGALNLEIESKRDAEMRAALGEEGFKEWDTENMRREINRGAVPLNASETNVAYALWKKLQQRNLDLRLQKSKGAIDEAGAGQAYAKDLAEFQSQMKTLLGDERYAQSQGTGPAAIAANLKQDLASANPTPAQFQELLDTQQQWDALRAKLADGSQNDAEYAQRLADLDEARDEEYRRVLGPAVFDSLQKQQDPGYSQMKKYEAAWGLDDSKIDYVYSALKYYQKNAEDYQAQARALEEQGQKVDWDAISQNLAQFAQENQHALQSYLGEASYQKLKQNGVVQLDQPTRNLPNSPGVRRF